MTQSSVADPGSRLSGDTRSGSKLRPRFSMPTNLKWQLRKTYLDFFLPRPLWRIPRPRKSLGPQEGTCRFIKTCNLFSVFWTIFALLDPVLRITEAWHFDTHPDPWISKLNYGSGSALFRRGFQDATKIFFCFLRSFPFSYCRYINISLQRWHLIEKSKQ